MNKFTLFLTLLMLFSVFSASAQFKIDDYKKASAIVYGKNGSGNFFANGTGFFIMIDSPKSRNKQPVYLVTAKHVLKSQDGSYFKQIQVLTNGKDSAALEDISIIPTGPDRTLYLHPDSTVDIAAVTFLPKQTGTRIMCLDSTMLSTRTSANLFDEGQEAFFTGLFVPIESKNKLYPIVRYGHVSLIPDEKIFWEWGKTNMFLVEISSFPGNSGSPVYFKVPLLNNSYRILLGGVMSGNYLNEVQVNKIWNPNVKFSNGIAGVVPVYYLHELLYSDEMKKQRQ